MCYRRFDCFYRKFPFDRNLISYAFYRTYFGHLSSTGKDPILFNFYIFFRSRMSKLKIIWIWLILLVILIHQRKRKWQTQRFWINTLQRKSFVVVMPFRWQIMQSTRLLDRLMKRLVAKIFKHFVHEWKNSKTIMF